MKPYRQVTVLAVAFFVLGIVLIAAAAFQFFRLRAFVRTAHKTVGRVVELDYRSGSRSSGYVTLFTFSDSAGHPHTVRTSSAHNPATHKVGDEVVVLYQPSFPEAARIRSFRTLWIGPIILGSFGLAFSSIGGLAFRAARRTYGSA